MGNTGKTLRSCVQYVLATYVLLLALFVGTMTVAHLIPHRSIEGNVSASVETLSREGKYPCLLGVPLFRIDTFTDALMLNMAWCADEVHPVDAAIQNRYYTDDAMNVFERTQEVVSGNVTPSGYYYSYARYWHGYQAFLRPLLVLADYHSLCRCNTILMGLTILLCLWIVASRLSPRTAAFLLVSLLMVAVPMVPLCLQYSTCFYVSLWAVIALLAVPRLSRDTTAAACTFFAIGGITSFLDLLTTPVLTLGLPLLVCLLARPAWQSVRRVVQLSACWLAGYVSLWVSKCLLAQVLTDYDILGSFLRALGVRSFAGTGNLLRSAAELLGTHGVLLLAAALLALLLLLVPVGVSCWRRASRSPRLRRNAWLLAVALIPVCWYLLTLQHSIVHYWFTWRSLAVTFFSLFLFIHRLNTAPHETNSRTHSLLQ